MTITRTLRNVYFGGHVESSDVPPKVWAAFLAYLDADTGIATQEWCDAGFNLVKVMRDEKCRHKRLHKGGFRFWIKWDLHETVEWRERRGG